MQYNYRSIQNYKNINVIFIKECECWWQLHCLHRQVVLLVEKRKLGLLKMEQTLWKEIFFITEHGTEDIISFRSKTFQKLNLDIESMSIQELYKVIQDNPGMLRRPIIVDDKRLQVGYNEDEIRRFLPKEIRVNQLKQIKNMVK